MDSDLESSGGRLRWTREKAGFSDASDFAKVVGIKPVSYRAYENGQNGYAKHAALFARKLGVTAEWLLEGGVIPDITSQVRGKPTAPATPRPAPDIPPARSADGGETVEIIQLDLSLPMGPGATVDDYIEEEPRLFDLAFVRTFTKTPPHRLRLARGVGDSMFPTLLANDLVWIDSTQNRLNMSDRIYAVSINGGAAIKRLRPLDGGRRVLVLSDNPGPGHEPYEVDASEILIGGRVIRYARDI